MIRFILWTIGIIWLLCIIGCIIVAVWIEKPITIDDNGKVLENENK